MTWVMVLLGAAIGAPLRYVLDRAIQARHDTVFPWGTFTVNLTACATLGFLAGATDVVAMPQHAELLIGPGLCGALSTYSTFSFETLRLAETGSRYFAAANVVASVAAGLGTAVLASALAHALLR